MATIPILKDWVIVWFSDSHSVGCSPMVGNEGTEVGLQKVITINQSINIFNFLIKFEIPIKYLWLLLYI